MNSERIGPIEIIMGEKQSRSPFSTSLLIRGKDGSTLIDCGGGPSVFEYLKQQRIGQIFLTHYHPDHTSGIGLFAETQTVTNPYDYGRLLNTGETAKSSLFPKRAGSAHLIYPYHQFIDMSGVRAMMLHAPGHSEGFCCPYFPDLGILHIGDIDLTTFGPWYFSPDSHIDQFIDSARKTLEIDAKFYVTSHQKGIVLQAEYRSKLEEYLDIIERREEKIKRAIKQGCSPADLVRQDVIYFQKDLDRSPWILQNEKMGIAKHLIRLIEHHEPLHEYLEAYMSVHKLERENINRFTQPNFYGTAAPEMNSKMNE